jgi:hypothetical protein
MKGFNYPSHIYTDFEAIGGAPFVLGYENIINFFQLYQASIWPLNFVIKLSF